jgi:very-short-patch-repair endonuclease
LVERIGPAVFNQRKLRCGNPYAFQGDERDVMFLSMVAAPNTNNASLTTRVYQQRFNVAMSRARDQAWLFHSIQEHELGPNCLRRRLLEFFRQPPDLTIHGSSVDTPTLQLAAQRADRMAEHPPAPFDSWFEVDVALALSVLGYTLSAQVQVARKRIDLVIEGNDGARLGVECDGEAWHGPEQYDLDVTRGYQLERAGWRLVRVRESLFYSDKAKAIREVIRECEELDIAPGDGRARPSSEAAHEGAPATDIPEEHQSQAETIADDYPQPLCSRRIPEDQGKELWVPESESALLQGTLDLAASSEQRTGPFTGYGAKRYPDPRTAPAANIREAVLDIITTDGPMPKESLYRLYREGCPRVERAGKSLRHAVNQAVYSLERAGLVVNRDEGTRHLPNEVIVKLSSHRWVDPRPVGSRRLEDVPLSELGSAMHEASHGLKPQSDPERINLYREVAGRYGVRRLMPQPLQRLGVAERVAFDSGTADGHRLF